MRDFEFLGRSIKSATLLQSLGNNAFFVFFPREHCTFRFQINNPKAIWTKNNLGVDPETLGIRTPSSYVFGLNINI